MDHVPQSKDPERSKEPAGVDPERDPNPTEQSELHPARAKDDGSSARDAPEPGPSDESRALAVEPAGVEPVAATGVIGGRSVNGPKGCGKHDRVAVTPNVTRLPTSDGHPE
jgi:hypothetical protein